MLLLWNIRYLDTRNRQFETRSLWLNTDSLEPGLKAAVEATHALKEHDHRGMLRFRHLFHEGEPPGSRPQDFGGLFIVPDYFEDENCQELTYKRMGAVLTGDPQAEFFPPGTAPHYAEYYVAEKPPIHLDQITLSPDDLNTLGYFVRDVRELLATALYTEGPGTLTSTGSPGRHVLRTAASDEEIRSFVTIFRRLYMEKEPGNFRKAVGVFVSALPGHPVGKLVQAIATQYESALDREPESVPMLGPDKLPFMRKRLIDVYLYTQYAHQPVAHRVRQFNECLAAVGGDRPTLTWLFLVEVWKCALEMGNAGAVIAEFYDRYRQCHGTPCGALESIRTDHPGIGALEKRQDQEARILREKAEELARTLLERAGRPAGGHAEFIDQALKELRAATGRTRA